MTCSNYAGARNKCTVQICPTCCSADYPASCQYCSNNGTTKCSGSFTCATDATYGCNAGAGKCSCGTVCKNRSKPCGGTKTCHCDQMSVDCPISACPRYCDRLATCPQSGCQAVSCSSRCNGLMPTDGSCNANYYDPGRTISHQRCSNLDGSYTCDKTLCALRPYDKPNQVPPCLGMNPDHGYWCCSGCDRGGNTSGKVNSGCGSNSPGGNPPCMSTSHCRDGNCWCNSSVGSPPYCGCNEGQGVCKGAYDCLHCLGTDNDGQCPTVTCRGVKQGP